MIVDGEFYIFVGNFRYVKNSLNTNSVVYPLPFNQSGPRIVCNMQCSLVNPILFYLVENLSLELQLICTLKGIKYRKIDVSSIKYRKIDVSSIN